MFIIIPLILVVGSAFGIGWIIWPKFKEVKQKENLPEIKENFWYLMFLELFNFLKLANFRLKTFRENMIVDYEKFLRRVKILSLKTDNAVNRLLEKRPRVKAKKEVKSFERPAEKESNVYFKNKESHLISEIAKNPKDKNLYKILGTLYVENKMYADAREVFNVVLELDQNDSETKENIDKIVNLM